MSRLNVRLGSVLLTERFQLVSGQPLPGPLVVKEKDEIVRPGVGLGQVQHLHWRHGDGNSVVEVASPRHLGVDDEGRVPGIASALGPHQVQGLQLDVGGRHPGKTLLAGLGARVVIGGGGGVLAGLRS